MKKIIITSDPYNRETTFQVYRENEGWKFIDCADSKTKLVGDEIRHQFFPLKIQDIINILVNEYGIGDEDEKLELIFRGTLDHYEELKFIVDTYSSNIDIQLKKDEKWLNNAQDVLPEIIKVYNELKPIIDLSKKNKCLITQYIEKFTDASTDKIPLCVVGNYSSGKSTFINSLMGREILPSGDDPVTAKVFKIHQIGDEEDTWIDFILNDKKTRITFFKDSYEISNVMNEKFEQNLKEILTNLNEDERVNKSIEYLNSLNADEINPIIEIGISFKGGMWSKCDNRFIILDTPGSNSATNVDHGQVLDMALKGLTNGLPLYVSENNKLDSQDNLSLYKKLKSMDEIDSRFTMIIVNKADDCDLPEEGYYSEDKIKSLLNQAVPKNMYSLGIYYVSSIMGLGSKNEEYLVKNHSKRTYKKNKVIFMSDDPVARLYAYNVMPKQIKEESNELCLNSNENIVYVNSGLYSVEQGIQNFANKYSSYNKCYQSVEYLNKIIELVNEEILEDKYELKEQSIQIQNEMREKKEALILSLTSTRDNKKKEFVEQVDIFLDEYKKEHTPIIDRKSIKELELEYTKEQEQNQCFEEYEKQVSTSVESLMDNLKKGINDIKENPNLNQVRGGLFTTFVDDVNILRGKFKDKAEAKRTIDKDVSRNLIDYLEDKIRSDSKKFFEEFNLESKQIWIERAHQIRTDLIDIVTESDALNEEKKFELKKLIMDFENIEFQKSEEKILKIEKYKKIFNEEKLSILRLTFDVNNVFIKFVNQTKEIIFSSDKQSFENWVELLVNTLLNNLVQYNDILSKLQNELDEKGNVIEKLECMQKKIEDNVIKVQRLMNWQTE